MCRVINDTYNSEDPAIRARARGRAITKALARLVKDSDEGRYWINMRTVLSGGMPMTSDGRAVPTTEAVHNANPGDLFRHVWETHTPVFYTDKVR